MHSADVIALVAWDQVWKLAVTVAALAFTLKIASGAIETLVSRTISLLWIVLSALGVYHLYQLNQQHTWIDLAQARIHHQSTIDYIRQLTNRVTAAWQ
jgi:hypothetical protein